MRYLPITFITWKEASFSKRVHPRGDSYQPRESKGGDPTWQQGGRMRVGSARCGPTKLSNGFSKTPRSMTKVSGIRRSTFLSIRAVERSARCQSVSRLFVSIIPTTHIICGATTAPGGCTTQCISTTASDGFVDHFGRDRSPKLSHFATGISQRFHWWGKLSLIGECLPPHTPPPPSPDTKGSTL